MTIAITVFKNDSKQVIFNAWDNIETILGSYSSWVIPDNKNIKQVVKVNISEDEFHKVVNSTENQFSINDNEGKILCFELQSGETAKGTVVEYFKVTFNSEIGFLDKELVSYSVKNFS